MLKELADEGLVERRRKRLKRPEDLPSVTVLELTGRDARRRVPRPAGRMVGRRGRPAADDHHRADARPARPGARHRRPRARPPVAGGRDGTFEARVIKLIDKKPVTVLGVVRDLPDGKRIEPVDRKQREMILDADPTGQGQGRRSRLGDAWSAPAATGRAAPASSKSSAR